jgi:hypothetical protein
MHLASNSKCFKAEIVESVVEPVVILETNANANNYSTSDLTTKEDESSSRLKYGPVGPGDKRVTKNQSNTSIQNTGTDDELDSSDSSQFPRKSSLSQVSYRPLEIDSDVESDLSGTAPRSRKCIPSTDLDESSKDLQKTRLPLNKTRLQNFENSEDSVKSRSTRNISSNLVAGDSSNANSLEHINKPKNNTLILSSRGDFNEVGIPVVESYESTIKSSINSLRAPTLMTSMHYLDQNPDRHLHEQTRLVDKLPKKNDNKEMEENRNFRLEKLMQPIDYSRPATRPPSRDQGSSGFGSLQDIRDKPKLHGEVSDSRDSLSSKSSLSGPPKKGSPLCTDL